jgi:hypothetical protein
MYPYIVCFCGCSLGDIYDAFKAMRLDAYQKALQDPNFVNINPAVLAITANVKIDLSDVFVQLCITQECCQTRLNTQVEFKELY